MHRINVKVYTTSDICEMILTCIDGVFDRLEQGAGGGIPCVITARPGQLGSEGGEQVVQDVRDDHVIVETAEGASRHCRQPDPCQR